MLQPYQSSRPPEGLHADNYLRRESGLFMPSGVMRGVNGSRRAVISAGGGTLQDAVASTCFHLDATDAASTNGTSQTWSNLVTTPADGSAQTAFDVYCGTTGSVTTSDPTFNGTAGSSSAYWSFDGGDGFLSTQVSDVSPGFLNKVQRTDDTVGFWLASAFRYKNTATSLTIGNATATAEYGFRVLINTAGTLVFTRHRNSTVQTTILLTSACVDDSDYLLIISMNSTRTNFRVWLTSRTATSLAPAAAWTAVTSDASHRFGIGTNSPIANTFDPSGGRRYAMAGGNEYLDDTKAGLIYDYFNAKHGRTYA